MILALGDASAWAKVLHIKTLYLSFAVCTLVTEQLFEGCPDFGIPVDIAIRVVLTLFLDRRRRSFPCTREPVGAWLNDPATLILLVTSDMNHRAALPTDCVS